MPSGRDCLAQNQEVSLHSQVPRSHSTKVDEVPGVKLRSPDIFLDDDVILSQNFIQAHQESYADGRVKLVAGQIVAADRPVHVGEIDNFELEFPLSHNRSAWIKNMGGGNFSVIRELALEVGGFDQRFYRVAYREDSDFLFRFCAKHDCLAKYTPQASVVHLGSMVRRM